MSELDVLVVGGGISGLAAAHCLARSGLEVEVWESNARVGGKIQTSVKQGYRLDSAASMVMNFRSQLDNFLHTADLESYKQQRTSACKRYVLDDDRLCAAPSSMGELMKSSLFTLPGKLRMLAEPLVPRGSNPHESVAEFVTRRLGKEFLQKVFEPYVAGPLASDASCAEAFSTMPKLAALEKRYGSLTLGAIVRKAWRRGSAARPEVFSFVGGMGTLVDRLASLGGFRVRNSIRVNEVWPVRGGWMVRAARGNSSQSLFCRQLILSTPADAAAGLVKGLDTSLASLLQSIEYAPVKVVHTGFRRSSTSHALNGSGFLTPPNSGFESNGCLWISSLFPDHAPKGQVLFSSYLGGARNPGVVEWDKERSLSAVMRMLGALLGIKVEPHMLHIDSHVRALPLYHGAYSQRLASIDQRLKAFPGLFLEANYRGGVSVRDRILRAQMLANQILRQQKQLSGERTSVVMPGMTSLKVPQPVIMR